MVIVINILIGSDSYPIPPPDKPDDGSKESAGDCSSCQEAGGDQEAPGGVDVL